VGRAIYNKDWQFYSYKNNGALIAAFWAQPRHSVAKTLSRASMLMRTLLSHSPGLRSNSAVAALILLATWRMFPR
jgi:hypothetical protein